jgi:fructuronate reductase
MDGTQKIPQRWLAPITSLQQRGRPVSALLFALAAWIAFVCTPGRTLDDPLAAQLAQIRDRTCNDTKAAVEAIVGEHGLFSGAWRADSDSITQISAHLESIARSGMRHALSESGLTR